MEFIKEQLNIYRPFNDDEHGSKRKMLEDIENYGKELLNRTLLNAHFTSSIIVLNDSMSHVLMVFHNIYQSWSWIGGHNDGDDNFLQVAIKELKEETGLENFEMLDRNFISIETLAVKEHDKNGLKVPSHIHHNISYVAIASMAEAVRPKFDENSGVRWLEVDKLHQYINEEHMIDIYKKIIKKAKMLKN